VSQRTRERLIAVFHGICRHILVVLGVGVMMVAMVFGMSQCRGTRPSSWQEIANGALVLQFTVFHSALLSRSGRGLPGRFAPFGLDAHPSTTTFATIASVPVGLLFLLWTQNGIVWWRATGPWLAITLTLYATAWLLLLNSIIDAGFFLQVGLLGWWTGSPSRRTSVGKSERVAPRSRRVVRAKETPPHARSHPA